MNILREYIREELLLPLQHADTMQELLHRMCTAAEPWSGVPAESLERVIWEREKMGSTAVGNKVIIPHGRMSELNDVVLVIATAESPIPFTSENEDVQLVFLLAVPDNNNLLYLKLLAKISTLCSNKDIREALLAASSAHRMITIIEEAE